MSWQKVLTEPLPGGGRGARGGVIIDGSLLPMTVPEVFAQGKQRMTSRRSRATTRARVARRQIRQSPPRRFSAQAVKQRLRRSRGRVPWKLYPAATEEQARVSQNESSWDQQRMGTWLWARNRAKTAKTNAYTYFWDHALPGPDAALYGAFPQFRGAVCVEHALYGGTAVYGFGQENCGSGFVVLGAICDGRGSECEGVGAMAAGWREAPRRWRLIGDKPGAIAAAGSAEKDRVLGEGAGLSSDGRNSVLAISAIALRVGPGDNGIGV